MRSDKAHKTARKRQGSGESGSTPETSLDVILQPLRLELDIHQLRLLGAEDFIDDLQRSTDMAGSRLNFTVY